jgi:NAD(P)-dependent dehydrogenase (short-subunit alcohol dehydrogenase family)
MGYAIASIMGHQGDTLLLCDINEEALKKCTDMLIKQNMDAHYAVVDVSNAAQVQAAGEKAKKLGPVTKVVHTAGLSPIQVSKMEDAKGAAQIMKVNAMGTIHMVETFYPILDEGGAMVCFTSSAVYLRPVFPDAYKEAFDSIHTDRENIEAKLQVLTHDSPGGAYMASKCFVKRYVEMNAGRFGHKDCRINSIAPGRILTPMHRALIEAESDRIQEELASMPLGRYGNAYEIGNLVDFLTSPRASYVNGIDILMDDGTQAFTTVPQFKDV